MRQHSPYLISALSPLLGHDPRGGVGAVQDRADSRGVRVVLASAPAGRIFIPSRGQ